MCGDFCFLLHPKLTKQNDTLAIEEFRWVGLFIVVKVLTHSNYLIRRVNTTLTQVVHTIRSRKYFPATKPVDISVTSETHFEADTSEPESLEPNLFDIELQPPTQVGSTTAEPFSSPDP